MGSRIMFAVKGYRTTVANDEPAKDLVETEGVNAGSGRAERDRQPSGQPPVEARTGDPPHEAPPAERLVGPPDQEAATPGQELAAGEK
jgi:hypothetical protein